MKLSNDSKVLLVYFSSHDAKDQTVIHKGTAGEFRKVFGEDWDGFDNGDSFEIDFGNEGVKKVRVFKISNTLLEDDTSSGDKYFVAPTDLNPNKIEFENLNFEDYTD